MTIRWVSVLLLPVFLRGCWLPSEDADPAPQPQETAAKREPIDLVMLSLPPVSTFEASCANCHGPQGSFFGEEFGELPDEQLHDAVEEMMEGPAFLDPTDADLRAMVAYHHALAAREPFLCVTSLQLSSNGGPTSLEGEATPGATVSVAGTSAATTAGEMGTWQLRDIPASASLVLTAQKDGNATRLDLHQAQWSHASSASPHGPKSP